MGEGIPAYTGRFEEHVNPIIGQFAEERPKFDSPTDMAEWFQSRAEAGAPRQNAIARHAIRHLDAQREFGADVEPGWINDVVNRFLR